MNVVNHCVDQDITVCPHWSTCHVRWICLLGKGVTVVGVHPAVAYTNLRDKMLERGRWMKPLMKLTMNTPVQAAQTTIFAALDSSVINGNMYRSVLKLFE